MEDSCIRNICLHFKVSNIIVIDNDNEKTHYLKYFGTKYKVICTIIDIYLWRAVLSAT